MALLSHIGSPAAGVRTPYGTRSVTVALAGDGYKPCTRSQRVTPCRCYRSQEDELRLQQQQQQLEQLQEHLDAVPLPMPPLPEAQSQPLPASQTVPVSSSRTAAGSSSHPIARSSQHLEPPAGYQDPYPHPKPKPNPLAAPATRDQQNQKHFSPYATVTEAASRAAAGGDGSSSGNGMPAGMLKEGPPPKVDKEMHDVGLEQPLEITSAAGGIWLTSLTSGLWPWMRRALEEAGRAAIPMILGGAKPSWVGGIQLAHLSCGSIPPIITQLKVLNQAEEDQAWGGVILHMEIMWQSPEVDLQLKVQPVPEQLNKLLPKKIAYKVSGLTEFQVGMSQIKLKAKVQFRLAPFRAAMPLVRAIQISLLESPEQVDFQITATSGRARWPTKLMKPWLQLALRRGAVSITLPEVSTLHIDLNAKPLAPVGQTPAGVLLVRMLRGENLPVRQSFQAAPLVCVQAGVRQRAMRATSNVDLAEGEPSWTSPTLAEAPITLLVQQPQFQPLLLEYCEIDDAVLGTTRHVRATAQLPLSHTQLLSQPGVPQRFEVQLDQPQKDDGSNTITDEDDEDSDSDSDGSSTANSGEHPEGDGVMNAGGTVASVTKAAGKLVKKARSGAAAAAAAVTARVADAVPANAESTSAPPPAPPPTLHMEATYVPRSLAQAYGLHGSGVLYVIVAKVILPRAMCERLPIRVQAALVPYPTAGYTTYTNQTVSANSTYDMASHLTKESPASKSPTSADSAAGTSAAAMKAAQTAAALGAQPPLSQHQSQHHSSQNHSQDLGSSGGSAPHTLSSHPLNDIEDQGAAYYNSVQARVSKARLAGVTDLDEPAAPSVAPIQPVPVGDEALPLCPPAVHVSDHLPATITQLLGRAPGQPTHHEPGSEEVLELLSGWDCVWDLVGPPEHILSTALQLTVMPAAGRHKTGSKDSGAEAGTDGDSSQPAIAQVLLPLRQLTAQPYPHCPGITGGLYTLEAEAPEGTVKVETVVSFHPLLPGVSVAEAVQQSSEGKASLQALRLLLDSLGNVKRAASSLRGGLF